MKKILWIIGIATYLLVIGFLAMLAEGLMPTTVRHVLLAICVIGPLLLFGEAIGEALIAVVSYITGYALLPLLTLGTFRAERSDDLLSFPWYGVTRGADGKFVASADATAVLGFVIAGLAAFLGWIIFFRDPM